MDTQRDGYTWRVAYADGTYTNEYDAVRPDGRAWSEREQKPVKAVTLTDPEQVAEREHSVLVPAGASPVFFRRRRVALDPASTEQRSSTAHCIGWKREEQGVYLFVFDDGATLLTSDFQAV